MLEKELITLTPPSFLIASLFLLSQEFRVLLETRVHAEKPKDFSSKITRKKEKLFNLLSAVFKKKRH